MKLPTCHINSQLQIFKTVAVPTTSQLQLQILIVCPILSLHASTLGTFPKTDPRLVYFLKSICTSLWFIVFLLI
jgi:hypothetical protein